MLAIYTEWMGGQSQDHAAFVYDHPHHGCRRRRCASYHTRGREASGTEQSDQRVPVYGMWCQLVVPSPVDRLQASKGGVRKPYGETRAFGLKRGTLVSHSKYGRATVGGLDRKRQTISLHDYRTNKRLTQGAKVKDCQVLTWVTSSWFIPRKRRTGAREPPIPSPKQ